MPVGAHTQDGNDLQSKEHICTVHAKEVHQKNMSRPGEPSRPVVAVIREGLVNWTSWVSKTHCDER